MTRERIDLGKRGEELALERLRALGYKCIVRNYRCPLGEIDIIAKDGDCLVFVEIKTRRNKSLGITKEAVTGRKRRQLSKVALAYMKNNLCCDVKSRFDVVAINLSQGGQQIEIVKNAFDLTY